MPRSEALYSCLIHSAIVSLLVLTIGSLAVLLCRRPARRVWIIELTLAGCLIAPWLAMVPGYPRLGFGWRAATSLDQAEAALPASADQGERLAGPSVVPASDDPPILPQTVIPEAELETADAPSHAFDPASWIVAAYAVGVALGLGRWLVGLLGLVRIMRTTRPAPPRCRDLLAEIAGQGASRVRLLVSRRVRQPFAFALGRPVIVLPEDLCGDDRALRWSLAHEWTHIERHDFRAWLTAGLARVVFFYHPLVWWLRRQLRLCQDFLADDRAARQSPQPEDYAEFLTACAAARSLRPALAGLGMGSCKSELYRRVVMLVQNRPLESRVPRLWSVSTTVAALLFLGVVAALRATPREPAEHARDAADDTSAVPGQICLFAQLRTAPEGAGKEQETRGLIAIDPYGHWRWIAKVEASSPRLSPDGKTVAFQKQIGTRVDARARYAIFDGVWTCGTQAAAQPVKISDKNGMPVWSPNGRELLVTAVGDPGRSETWRMNANGSGAVKVPLPATDFVFDWSTDDKWCVASIDVDHPGRFAKPTQLYLIRPDGGQRQNLTREGRNLFARFSPDGRRVVYRFGDPNGERPPSLRVVNADGTGDRELVAYAGLVVPEDACWSPDGKYLAVHMVAFEELGADGLRRGSREWHLEIVAADGKTRRWLDIANARATFLGQPDWRAGNVLIQPGDKASSEAGAQVGEVKTPGPSESSDVVGPAQIELLKGPDVLVLRGKREDVHHIAGSLTRGQRAEQAVPIGKNEALLKERRETLRQLSQEVEQRYRSGLATLDSVIRASNLLLEAELDLAKTKAERVALCEKLVANLRQLETILESKHKVGAQGGETANVLDARAARLKAEIQLAHEKEGDK